MRLLNTLIFLFSLILGVPAHGAEISSKDLGDDVTLIAIIGEIASGDGQRFRLEAAKASNAVVALESEGGATLEAIEIGETIRIRGFSTLVINDSQCVSACALIWLAGTPRTLARSASVGFHATYTDEDGRKLESGVGNALVGRYLAILNLSQRAIVFATSAKPADMNWLNAQNSSQFGIETKLIDDFDDNRIGNQNSSRTPPPPIQTYRRPANQETTVWSNVGDWAVVIDHTLGDSCFALRAFDDGTFFRLGLDLRYGMKSYIMLMNREWASLKVGGKYPLILQFDDLDPWDAPMEAISVNKDTGLFVTLEDNKFWSEFASANYLHLMRNGKAFARMPLDNSDGAVDAVINCQKASNKVRAQRDPFAN